MLHIYIDADACPVKQEVYRVAKRYGLKVTLVAGSCMRIPDDDTVALEVVGQGMDVADDWIVEHVEADDIVITADIPLAARCVAKGASVLGPKGKPFTDDNIGDALATRNLLTDLRGFGEITGGPPPFESRDRSRFLQALDVMVNAIKKKRPGKI
ncbi:MAG: YaiI/YqxD family protein [Candidatus Latescibacterota bacterium]